MIKYLSARRASQLTIFLLAIGVLSSCNSYQTNSISHTTTVSGEMLFEGANTLQGAVSDLSASLQDQGIATHDIKSAKLTGIEFEIQAEDSEIIESLLFQVVSDQSSLKSLGSLSPLPEGSKVSLNLAEETEIVEYLRDEGATWVLDLNIDEDHMDEMIVSCTIQMEITTLEN